jgi:hypothetical protein
MLFCRLNAFFCLVTIFAFGVCGISNAGQNQNAVQPAPELISASLMVPESFGLADHLSPDSLTAKLLTKVAARQNLMLNGDFETCNLSQFNGKEALAHELRTVSSLSRSGKCSVRIEINANERDKGGNSWRAELTQQRAGSANHERDRWFGFSTYFPTAYKPLKQDVIFQIHEKPSKCEQYRTPPLYLLVAGEKMHWITRWDSKKCSVGDTAQGSKWITSSVVERNRWIDWVVHVRWSYGADGLIEIWRNATKIAVYRGPNDYNDEFEHYLKIGGYMWHGFPQNVAQRVSYLDDVRMGGPKATYADVAPR